MDRLIAGDRLPPTRELRNRYGVSPVTVSRALATLAAEGLVATRPGAGTFVLDPPRQRATPALDASWQTVALGDRAIDAGALQVYLEPVSPGTISLAGGYLHPSLLPARALTTALVRAARRPDAWERPPLSGLASLRSWFATSIGAGVEAEDVLVTSGGQSALSVALRSLVPTGAPLLVEAPTYPGALAAARAAGIRPVPVPVDAEGIRPELLAEAFRLTGARAVYLQPSFQNPTGAVLGPARRGAVLRAAADVGAFVIEDDFARHLAHDEAPPPPLIADDADGRVVHIASLTKPTSPSLRVGALVARGPVAERLRALRIVDDFFVARFVQEAALELVSGPAWRRHLLALRVELRRRRQTILASLAEAAPALGVGLVPRGGMHVWVRLPDGCDEARLAARCAERGVLVSPGRPYFASEPPAAHLRLSVAGAPDLVALGDAVRRLAGAL